MTDKKPNITALPRPGASGKPHVIAALEELLRMAHNNEIVEVFAVFRRNGGGKPGIRTGGSMNHPMEMIGAIDIYTDLYKQTTVHTQMVNAPAPDDDDDGPEGA